MGQVTEKMKRTLTCKTQRPEIRDPYQTLVENHTEKTDLTNHRQRTNVEGKGHFRNHTSCTTKNSEISPQKNENHESRSSQRPYLSPSASDGLQTARSSHSSIKRNHVRKGYIRDSSINILDGKSETENTEEATLGNSLDLVKRWGEGVPNSNTKGAINQQVRITRRESSLRKTPRFHMISYAFCKSKKTTRTNFPFSNAAETSCSK